MTEPYEMPLDGRSWNFFWQQVVATVTVDAILKNIFQGKKDDLRDQMLNVAAKECRRIDWGGPPLDINEKRREALLRQAKSIAETRKAGSEK